MPEDPTRLTAAGIARRVREGSLSPTAVVEAHLERIEARNDRTNAFVTVTAELARDEARAAEEAIEDGEPPAPLRGVPVAIKDLDDVAGVRTTSGSKLYADRIAEADDPFVARLREAGAIVVGKTNTPEFGLGTTTDNLLLGPTGSPFDPDRIAGGSSGGAGAALGDRLVPIAQGSDAGGSIRTPAHCCGVYGLKPTFGLVPRKSRPNAFSGHTPSTSVGPMARTVEDAALMLQVMAGPSPWDPFSLPEGGADYVAATSRPIDELRIAYSSDMGAYPLDDRVRDVLDDAVGALDAAGATVERVDPDLAHAGDEILDAYYAFARARWGDLLANLKTEGFDPRGADRDRLRPYLVELILESEPVTRDDLRTANRLRTELYDGFRELFEEYDLLATATAAVPPFPHGEYPETVDGVEIDPYRGWLLTQPFNLTGGPAASIPAGFVDGLPVGLQLAGPHHADDVVLAASAAFERRRPWHDAFPE